MTSERALDSIAVALDVPTLPEATALAEQLAGHVGWFKVGLELFSAHGPDAVAAIRDHGRVFLDVKLHDIPTTVERSARRLADLGVGLVTVHALGGPAMVQSAVHGLGAGGDVLAVTILTSMSPADLDAVHLAHGAELVPSLATMAVGAGAHGIVCGPGQATAVRGVVGADRRVVTPGIRPAAARMDDHAGVATPSSAIAAGADLLVVGRPITRSEDPVLAADRIAADVEAAHRELSR